MAFTLRIAFTGLGVAVIRTEEGSDVVEGVDLLMVRTDPNHHMPTHHHLARLTFQVEDVEPKKDYVFEMTQVDASGHPLAWFDLTDRDLQFNAPRDSRVSSQTFAVTRAQPSKDTGDSLVPNAVDWIPNLSDVVEYDPSILHPTKLDGTAYSSRVKLPPGNVESNGLMLASDGNPTLWSIGNSEDKPLAEQVVWTRTGVDRLDLGIDGLVLDGYIKTQYAKFRGDDEPVVTVAVTNLPEHLHAQRDRAPDHFPILKKLSSSGSEANVLESRGGSPLTHGGSCPPTKG